MQKKYYILISIVVLLLVILGVFIFNKKENDIQDTNTEQNTQDLTPGEVLENMEEPTTLGEDETLSIVSPEGDSFENRQARMWQGEFENISIDKSVTAVCHWEFYINEYDSEVLYQTMDNKTIVSKDSPRVCTFTSTFIEKKGALRVKLSVEVTSLYEGILGNYEAQREYTVF